MAGKLTLEDAAVLLRYYANPKVWLLLPAEALEAAGLAVVEGKDPEVVAELMEEAAGLVED